MLENAAKAEKAPVGIKPAEGFRVILYDFGIGPVGFHRDEVVFAVEGMVEEPARGRGLFPESRSGHRVDQVQHQKRRPAGAQEFAETAAGAPVFPIQAEDHGKVRENSVVEESLDLPGRRIPEIMLFSGGLQDVRRRAFDPDINGDDLGRPHHPEDIGMAGRLQGRLEADEEGKSSPLLDPEKDVQVFFHGRGRTAGEIRIADDDESPVDVGQRFQPLLEKAGGEPPDGPAGKMGDVAERTAVGAAPRGLK